VQVKAYKSKGGLDMSKKATKNAKHQAWSDYVLLRGEKGNRNDDLDFFSYAWYVLNHGLAN